MKDALAAQVRHAPDTVTGSHAVVRWGLLSTANINRRLIPAIRASQRGELVAVASRTQERAEAYAAEWGIEKAFGSYDAMLSSGAVDAVYIGLPNHLHAEWTVRALRSGLHVLCEKPFTITLKETDDVIEAAAETGKIVAEAFMYRHHPQTKLVRQWLQDGRLGDVQLVRGVFNFALHNRDNVRLVPEYGGGSLWDVGIYPLSYAQLVYGAAPLRVMAMQSVGASGVDELFVGQMQYGGGRVAQIASSFRTPYHTSIEIVGSTGRIYLSRPFTGVEDGIVTFYAADGEAQVVEAPQEPLYLGEVEDMHAAILDGAAPEISLQETRDHVRTALALYAAARSGQPVTL